MQNSEGKMYIDTGAIFTHHILRTIYCIIVDPSVCSKSNHITVIFAPTGGKQMV